MIRTDRIYSKYLIPIHLFVMCTQPASLAKHLLSSHTVAGNVLRPPLVGPEYLLRDVDAFSSEDVLRPADALHEPGHNHPSSLIFREVAVLESSVVSLFRESQQ